MILHPTRDEEGSALILALVFLSLFGLLIAAILGQVEANVRTTLVVRAHEAKVYGADAGIDYAIQALQFDDTICPDADSPQETLTPPAVTSGITVTVTCKTTEGNVLGIRGNAIVTTEPHGGATSLDTSNGSIDRIIEGPVFVAGDVTLAKPVTVKGANFTQVAPCQSTPITNLTVTPAPFTTKCSSGAVPDEAEHDLPGYPAGAAMPANGNGGSPCRTFMPGLYKTAPSLANQNFFASGFYYFEDIGDWNITQELFGGLPRPADGEPKSLTESPCVGTDPGTGQGVMFAFGGNSRFILGNGAHVELFSPDAAAVDPGDSGFSIRAVLSADTAVDTRWKASTPGLTIIDVDGGNTRDLAIHGLVYTPEQVVNLFVTGGGVNAQFLNGAKVRRLGLATSSSGVGLAISTKRGPGRRKVTLVAQATEAGGRTVEARAVIKIDNDEGRTVTVVSQSVQ